MHGVLFLLHLVLLAFDVVAFFLMVRSLVQVLRWKWLLTFDSVGKPIVDEVLSRSEQLLARTRWNRLRCGMRVLVCFFVVFVCRTIAIEVIFAVQGAPP